MYKGFEPVFNKESKVLILGSFPSVKSREVGFYYGNKQNRFWNMLENVFEEKIGENIEEKKAFLFRHNIALWDIVLESDLNGSADLSLEKSTKTFADLSSILPPNSKIEKIICNGKTSYNAVLKSYITSIPVIYLPSTSSANPSYSLSQWKGELKKSLN